MKSSIITIWSGINRSKKAFGCEEQIRAYTKYNSFRIVEESIAELGVHVEINDTATISTVGNPDFCYGHARPQSETETETRDRSEMFLVVYH